MKGLTGNILRTFSTQVPSIVLSIITGIFLTRLLGTEGKGVYAIFYANIEIMVMVFAMGCDLGIIYFGSNKKIAEGKLQGIASLLLLIFLPLVFLTVFTFKTDFLFPEQYDNWFFRLFLCSMFGLQMLNTVISSFLKSYKSFKHINRINLLNSIFNLLTYSLLFYFQSQGKIEVSIAGIFTISLIILGINSLLWIISFALNMKFKPDFKLSYKEDLVPFFTYIFPVFISLIINFLNYRLDIWLVSYYEGNIQLGLYALAVNFAQFVLLYARIIGSVMMPYLSENNAGQRKKYFVIYSRITFSSVILMVSLLYLIGNYLLVFLYGEDFAMSVNPFKILLGGMIFTSMSQLFSIMLFSKGNNRVALVANSVGLVATVAFDVLLIPVYGIEGAAVATAISYFTIFAVLLIYLLSRERISFFELFIIKSKDLKTIFQDD